MMRIALIAAITTLIVMFLLNKISFLSPIKSLVS